MAFPSHSHSWSLSPIPCESPTSVAAELTDLAGGGLSDMHTPALSDAPECQIAQNYPI